MASIPTPKSKLVVETSSFSNPKNAHKKYIYGHPFNAAVEIILPGCKNILPDLADCLPNQQTFYHVKNLPITEFVSVDFINRFIKKGECSALSIGHNIDTDNVVAVLPTGVLLLSVDKDTYEELGLVGKPSQFNSHKKPRKFVIEIDLTAACFHPGKKNYERVLWCFKDRLGLTFDFYMTWDLPGNKEKDDCIKSFFHNYTCEEVKLKESTQRLSDIVMPVIRSDTIETTLTEDGSSEQCNVYDFYEWLGALACHVDCSVGKPDGFVSTYTCPEPQHTVQHSVLHQYTGFVTPSSIEKLLDSLRSCIKSNKTSWASITVHGFMDSPVSWKHREHGFYTSGDNLYTFVVFPDDTFWLYMNVSSHDVCP